MHVSAMLAPGNRAQRLFACLGDPSRFRVVTTLVASECCVTDLARKIGLSQSCTTRHLQALQREGLVVGLRDGKRVVFRLNTDEPLIAGLVAWASGQGVPSGTTGEGVPPDPPSGMSTTREDEAPSDLPEADPGPDAPDRRRLADLEDFLL